MQRSKKLACLSVAPRLAPRPEAAVAAARRPARGIVVAILIRELAARAQ